MNYIIELNKDELRLLRRLAKLELTRIKIYEQPDIDNKETQLLMLMGKLDNVIPIADKITEDTSILAARKYGLFGRK